MSQFPSTDTPRNIPPSNTIFSNIVVPGPGVTIAAVTVDVDITSPSSDPTQLVVIIYWTDGFTNCLLHNASSSQMTPSVNYPNTATPDGSLSVFNGLNSAGTWKLQVSSSAFGVTGTLNSWGFNITAAVPPPQTAYVPLPAAYDTIPQVNYDVGGSIKGNIKYAFNSRGYVGLGGLLDTTRAVAYTGKVQDVLVSAVTVDSVADTVVSLHRVNSGSNTIIASGTIPKGSSFSYKFINCGASVVAGDLLYVSVDSTGGGVLDLTVQATVVLN